MKTCSDFKDTLMLDVHGELTSAERIGWEKHLAACEDCQQEKKKLCVLIKNAKEGFLTPLLSSEEEHCLSSSVQRTLRTQKPDAVYKRLGWRIAPAFGACLIIVFAGWFGLKDFKSPDAVTVKDSVSEEVIVNNEELLENMELLQEMEALEQLVDLLDKQNFETSLLESDGSANNVRMHV